MDIQTDRVFDKPGDNFFVARYSKDLFGRSKVGGLVVNKETAGASHFNRMIVADTMLAPTRSLSFHTFLARTSTPGVSDGQQAFHARALLLNTKWQTFAEYTDIEDQFQRRGRLRPAHAASGRRKCTSSGIRGPAAGSG